MSESPFIRIEFMLQEDTGELILDFEHDIFETPVKIES